MVSYESLYELFAGQDSWKEVLLQPCLMLAYDTEHGVLSPDTELLLFFNHNPAMLQILGAWHVSAGIPGGFTSRVRPRSVRESDRVSAYYRLGQVASARICHYWNDRLVGRLAKLVLDYAELPTGVSLNKYDQWRLDQLRTGKPEYPVALQVLAEPGFRARFGVPDPLLVLPTEYRGVYRRTFE